MERAHVHDLVSFAILVFVRDSLWSSSVETCRLAQVARDLASFAVLVLVCDNLWSSSIQTRRRAQVARDLLSFAILVFACDNLSFRAHKRVGAHKSFAIL